ncbi:MAG: hypothetical protein H6641_16205 [Caldilineaceae bacterium]|nr:hypothetical protein [Caldilineaceae bacterium]
MVGEKGDCVVGQDEMAELKSQPNWDAARYWQLAKAVLTKKQHDVVRLRYDDELSIARSYGAVGRILQIGRGQVQGRLRWGLRAMERAWKEQYGDELIVCSGE